MDFDHAAQRLARDQNKLRARHQNSNYTKNNNAISAKAKREVLLRKQQQERLLIERRRKQRQREFMEQTMRQCDRNLHLKQLIVGGGDTPLTSLRLQATSIHGEGDKIALPPSVLEFLTSNDDNGKSNNSSPWTFRIGILNPDYVFPQSKLLQELQPPPIDDDDDVSMDSDDDDDDDKEEATKVAAYRQELSHKYLALTHGTVVEFTQEEGHVGLPASIAGALVEQLQQQNQSQKAIDTDSQKKNAISSAVTRTVDPASSASSSAARSEKGGDDNGNEDDQVMMESSQGEQDDNDRNDSEKTPGHLAWGAFDVPTAAIEVSLVQLPKGRACTLVPTPEALERGFYGLKDIKLVLEQSLIRTRAVLSLNDTVHTWHRGVQYNVRVSELEPAQYGAVVCINTDITVDFGSPSSPAAASSNEQPQQQDNHAAAASSLSTLDQDVAMQQGGYTLAGGRRTLASTESPPPPTVVVPQLPPEPPVDAEKVILVQIRCPSGQSTKRRFLVETATVADLFALASTVVRVVDSGSSTSSGNFCLVTRFPRRVFHPLGGGEQGAENRGEASSSLPTLEQVGLAPGQELFMVENL